MDLVREHFPEPTHLVPPLPVGPTLTCVPAFYSCRTLPELVPGRAVGV